MVYRLFVASAVSETIPVYIDLVSEANQNARRLLVGGITFHIPILDNMEIKGSAKLGFLGFGFQEGNIVISNFSPIFS